MPDTLFVYGSLRSEFQNQYVDHLRKTGKSLGKATVRGSIFMLGKYPGYQREPDGVVQGELWRLHDAEATLSLLDHYEGASYVREIATADRGEAWIYVFVGEVDPASRIASGDFLTR